MAHHCQCLHLHRRGQIGCQPREKPPIQKQNRHAGLKFVGTHMEKPNTLWEKGLKSNPTKTMAWQQQHDVFWKSQDGFNPNCWWHGGVVKMVIINCPRIQKAQENSFFMDKAKGMTFPKHHSQIFYKSVLKSLLFFFFQPNFNKLFQFCQEKWSDIQPHAKFLLMWYSLPVLEPNIVRKWTGAFPSY